MSSASTTRTIKFVSKAGTYTAVIMCPEGDLYQEWEGSVNQVTGVYPNFAATKPILYFICTSSRVAEGVTTPDSIDYYFNGTKITWNGDTSSGTFDGVFKKVSPSGDNLYYGLQILQNIAAPAGYATAVIRMVANVSYGTQSDQIEASYNIPIQQATGNGVHVTIVSPDNKYFVIGEKGGSCQLKAMAYQKGTELTAGLSYVWEKMAASGWEVMMTATTQAITVADSDINSYGEFRVTVKRDSGRTDESGNAIVEELGKDIQGVMDASDPLQIDPHPAPEDETITEDESGNGQVVYKPVVVKRGTNTKALDTTFYFVVKDAAGNYLNPGTKDTAKSSETVTREQCVQAGGDVSISITSKD